MKHIITIGRQFGSGGTHIGRAIAEKLGVKCYDKEILVEAAKISGTHEVLAEQFDETGQQSFFYSLVSQGYIPNNINYQPVNEEFYKEQFQLIRSIAEEEDGAVFIGRCADYVLDERDDLLRVFVTADLDYRVNAIAKKYDMSETEAYKLVTRRDAQREAYYNYYTNKKWTDITGYDLVLNVSDLGVDGAMDVILKYMDVKENKYKTYIV